jgi:diguanylate cyclase (GGDEF)-like protein
VEWVRDITQRKQREEKIRYISYHDSLTDLYNRTYIEEKIARLNQKSQLPLSIIMVDINGLKMINEGYGHKKGDQVLIQTADILSSWVKEKDILARWTGDEFIILLPQSKEKQTKDIIKQIRKEAKTTQISDIPLSLGIGYALKTDPEQDIYEVLYKAEDYVYRDKLTKNRSIQNKLVQNMLNTLGAKSDETKEHAIRMTSFAFQLGEKIGLNHNQLNNLSLLATLHDVGKVNIAEEILKKPDKLTEKEWKAIKEHPEKGSSIASAIKEFAPIAESILAHHERWDGDGYPQGISGKDIPLLARIISIVDAYDVMTNGRPYKEPMSKEEAIEELKKWAGSQFDPELVEVFVKVI